MIKQESRVNIFGAARVATLLLASSVVLASCNTSKILGNRVTTHGYQINEETLALVPEGSSREQVLLSLGTPSTTMRQADGEETFYYISQTKKRRANFMNGRVVDQRVLAIYLNEEDTVDRIGNYGLKDGKVFDFTRRVTPTGGKDLNFLSQLLGAAGSIVPGGGGNANDSIF